MASLLFFRGLILGEELADLKKLEPKKDSPQKCFDKTAGV